MRIPAVDGDSPPGAPPSPHTFRRAWWHPLGVVLASLILLAVAPFVTSARVRARWMSLTEQVDPARVLVNDVEAALDSLVRRLGPTVTERFAETRTLAAEWHRAAPLPAADTGAVAPRVGPARPQSRNALALARSAMDAADALEHVLDALSAERRADIRVVEREDRFLPLALVPLAVVSVGIVLRTGEQLVRLATAADEGRRTLAAAAATREALLRGVTHDVKNPLGAALGYAQLLEEGVLGPVSDAQRDVAVRLRRLMQGALTTVTDLLELSRAEAA